MWNRFVLYGVLLTILPQQCHPWMRRLCLVEAPNSKGNLTVWFPQCVVGPHQPTQLTAHKCIPIAATVLIKQLVMTFETLVA